MPAYSGKFQYLNAKGEIGQQGACEVSFDTETCVATPSAGIPLAFDLGDVDIFTPGEWDLSLQLYTGDKLQLRQFGPAFGRLSSELLAAWRDRTVQCLLLEDLEEISRFSAPVNGTTSEIRIYGSNIAVLPLGGPAEQWRLAELDSMAFDESSYTFNLASGERKLNIAKLGKKTEEFGESLRTTLDALRRHEAEALHQTFPFLDPGQLQRLVGLMPEGRSVRLAALAGIHPGLPEALVARAVDESLKPYFEYLKGRASEPDIMTGFKFVRPDEASGDPGGPQGDDQADATGDEAGQPLFFWFFFPWQDGKVTAWEATTGSGRATYFFRAGAPMEESIARLTRGLALVNFRREPVYLPDASLDQQPKFHRYAIGKRKQPELAELRAAFLGRAIHSSVEQWEKQVAEIQG